MSILAVTVRAPEVPCSWLGEPMRSCYLEFEDALHNPNLVLEPIERLARELLPGATENEITYLDDEGDPCTLTKETVRDMLAIVSAAADKAGDATDRMSLELCARTVRPATSGAAPGKEESDVKARLRAELSAKSEEADALSAALDTSRVEASQARVEVTRLSALCDRLRAEGSTAALEAEGATNANVALVLNSMPLVLGVEAEEDNLARGDVTKECVEAIASAGARQAFCIGRVRLTTGVRDTAPVPASAKFVMKNDGQTPWADTTVLARMMGDSLGLPILPVTPVGPGETSEVVMDLLVPSRLQIPGTARSIWSVVDAATGRPLGPLLVFETTCESE